LLRSVKYGVCGAVVAASLAAPAACTSVATMHVRLEVDGRAHQLRTEDSTVGAVLRDAGYRIDSHDLLAPSATTRIHDGSTIVFRRGRLLHLTVDGVARSVWTTAPTVAAALAQLGYPSTDFTSVSRSRRLPLKPTDIAVRTPKTVTVVHDGGRQTVDTTDLTVRALLTDLQLTLEPADRLSVPLTGRLRDGERIRITRVQHRSYSTLARIPYATHHENDARLAAGTTRIVRPGRDGLKRTTWAVVYVNGKPAGRTRVDVTVLRAPRSELRAVGTKRVHHTGSIGSSPGSAKAIARQLLAARGWGDAAQYSCLVTLWDHESGWRVHAANASGAYGIPQALPGSKMASAGADWQNSARTQITWGLNYIAARYGTPCGAWSQWQANGGWY
jgi:uncharacterized protein YabE (DUF348 family)